MSSDDPSWPRTGTGPYGLAPYGDQPESQPEPSVQVLPDAYRPFWATDARSVIILLEPSHTNFIPNPALRVDDTGWQPTGFTDYALDPDDSWVGQSIAVTGQGTLRFYADPAANQPVYVGPTTSPVGADWNEPDRAGAEYCFSVYAKGTSYFQLVLTGYLPVDGTDITSPPRPEPIGQVASEYFTVDSSDWERFDVQTTSWLRTISDEVVDFAGAYWVDCLVQVYDPDSVVKFSAFQLDSHEGEVGPYFDGGMDETVEESTVDDFFWLAEPNNSVSVYYRNRLVRTQWLYSNLYSAVPAGMPVQIFYHDFEHPFVPAEGVLPGGLP